jgi:hypothetical protein
VRRNNRQFPCVMGVFHSALFHSKLLLVLVPEIRQLWKDPKHYVLSFVRRHAHYNAVFGFIIADLHPDVLRAAIGYGDHVIKHIVIDQLRFRGAGATEARLSGRADVAFVDVVRGGKYRA